MSKKEYSQEEIARFERIRLYEIDKTKKEINHLILKINLLKYYHPLQIYENKKKVE